MTDKSKYYKMDPSDASSVRLESFPPSAVLGTDADGNIADVSSSLGKVKVNTSDSTAGYLEDKIADTVDIDWTPNSDNSKLESIIYQLTGRGAALVAKHVLEANQLELGNSVELQHPYGPGITGFTTGRGCYVGRIYKLDPLTGQKVKKKAWIAQSSDGTLFSSIDNFESGLKDLSLKTYDASDPYGARIPTYNGCHAIAYTKRAGVDVWVAFVQTALAGYYYIEDIPANYNDDGTFVTSSWNWYDVVSPPSNMNVISHIVNVKGGGVFATSTALNGVVYSSDLITWTKVLSTGGEVSGIAYDSEGNYLTVQRNTGIIYRNNSENTVGGFVASAWTPLTSALGLRVDNVKVDNLPITGSGGGLSQTWWAGVGCGYGLWVITAANRPNPNSDPLYVYSSDGVKWYTYGQKLQGTISLWDMVSDGTFFYGCPVGTQTPIVDQVIVNSIPAHKRLIAEKGLLVIDDAFLADMPNATRLGTDENGKIIASYDSASSSKKYYTAYPDLVRGDSSEVMAVSATFNGVDTSGWAVSEIVELEFHLMMPPLELNGSLTSGGSKVVNVAGPPRQVFCLFENTTLDTAGVFQIQGLMNDRPSAGTSVDKSSKRPYKVTLEIEKTSANLIVRGATLSVPYYVSGSVEKDGVLSFGYIYDNHLGTLFHPSAVPGSALTGAFDHFTIGLNLDWLGELALAGCENFSSAFVSDDSLTAVLEVNRIKKGV